MMNPLLAHDELPAFAAIRPEHVTPAVSPTVHVNRVS